MGVIPPLRDWNLAASKNDWFTKILKHERKDTCRINQCIGSMDNDEGVEMFIVLTDSRGDFDEVL